MVGVAMHMVSGEGGGEGGGDADGGEGGGGDGGDGDGGSDAAPFWHVERYLLS